MTYRCIVLALVAAALAACSSTPKPSSEPSGEPIAKPKPMPTPVKPGGYYQDDGPGDAIPPGLANLPDAEPRAEALHRFANRPYQVFGITYVPNVNDQPYRERGIGSWYGKKFHGQATSSGETYDMFAMTAAHKTLPIPSYVRVSNPANGKAVVVRVNDRGPFHGDRLIDLSYAAAYKLGYIQQGSTMLDVERVFPNSASVAGSTQPSLPTPAGFKPPLVQAPDTALPPVGEEAGGLFVQLGAFASRENAQAFAVRLARELHWLQDPIQLQQKDGVTRTRIGPYKSRAEAEAVASKVRASLGTNPVITRQ